MTLFAKQMSRGFAALLTLSTLSACADTTGPVREIRPNPIIIIGGHPVVFNSQLRFIGNPDTQPQAVVGHLQLKLLAREGTGVVVEWKAHLSNMECESATSLGGGIYFIQDSEDFPSPEDVALMELRLPRRVDGCVLGGVLGIPEELATRMINSPDNFVAAFFGDDGSVIGGTLLLAAPDA